MVSRSILFFCHLIVRRGLTYAGVSRLTSRDGLPSRETDEAGVANGVVLRPRQIGNLRGKLPPHPMDARKSQVAFEASPSRRRRGRGHLPSARRLHGDGEGGRGSFGTCRRRRAGDRRSGQIRWRSYAVSYPHIREKLVAGTMQRFSCLSHPPRAPVRT